MSKVQHFYFELVNDIGEKMRMAVSIDVEAVGRCLAPRVRKSKRGIAQAMYGAIEAERMDAATETKS